MNMVAGMPIMPFILANEFINVLKKKHAAGTYKEMVRGDPCKWFCFLKLIVYG